MPRNKSKKNQNRAQVQRAQRVPYNMALKPCALQTGTVVRQWYRFRCNSQTATGTVVTVQELLNACGNVAAANAGAGAGTLFCFANAARLLAYRAWGAAPSNTTQSNVTFATVSLDFDVQGGAQTATGLQITDTTMSPSQLAFISGKPPKDCFASFWHNRSEGGSTLFIGQMPLSGVLDLHVEWVLSDADTVTSHTNIAAVNAGMTYYSGLGAIAGPLYDYVPIGRQVA